MSSPFLGALVTLAAVLVGRHSDRADAKPPPPQSLSPSHDSWILWGALLAAVVSAVSFLNYFADRNDTVADPPWIVEEFNTDRADLAGSPLADGHQWEVADGAFRVADGAVTATAPTFGPAFAVVRFDEAPTAVAVLVARVAAGSGVVFDFADESNYWSVEATPESGTWEVFRVQAGRKALIANSGTNFRPGSTIEVSRSDGRVDISIDGALMPAFIVDERPVGAGAGLLAGPAEQGVTMWSRFLVSGPPQGGQRTSS